MVGQKLIFCLIEVADYEYQCKNCRQQFFQFFQDTGTLGYSKKLKFWSWTLVTQGIFVMTLLDNLSQKFAQKKHIFPSLITNLFYKGI